MHAVCFLMRRLIFVKVLIVTLTFASCFFPGVKVGTFYLVESILALLFSTLIALYCKRYILIYNYECHFYLASILTIMSHIVPINL